MAGTSVSTSSSPETSKYDTRDPKIVNRTRASTVAISTASPPSSPQIAVNGEQDPPKDALTPAASSIVASAPSDSKGVGFNIAGMVSGWGKRGTDPPPATREIYSGGKSQSAEQQRQQREIRRPPNQQQQPPATETKSIATSSSTDLAGGTITSSGTGSIGFENETNIPGASAAAANASVSRAAMSEVEKRARQYVQEKADATEGLEADNVRATTEGIVGGTGKQSSGKQSPLSSSRTQKALEAKRRSAKVGNERSSTLPKKNAAEGGAKDSGNPFVVGPDLR